MSYFLRTPCYLLPATDYFVLYTFSSYSHTLCWVEGLVSGAFDGSRVTPSSSLLTGTIFIQVPPLPADVQKALERKRDAARKLSNNQYSI